VIWKHFNIKNNRNYVFANYKNKKGIDINKSINYSTFKGTVDII